MNKVRYKFLEVICDLVRDGKDIVLVTSDYAAPVLDDYRRDHADRYVSVGIAEQDLIQIASGLALSGHRAIAYGMAPFPCIRAVDQIKNIAAMMNLPIVIVSAGVGFAIPEFGATHYATEDVSIMRTIPNVRIINLTDEAMAKKAAELTLTAKQPIYIRIDKYSDGTLYNENDIDFDKGFGVVRDGKDAALIVCGYYTDRAICLAKKLEKENISVKVIDLYSLPFDEQQLVNETDNCGAIVTIEEHVLEGGIGSAVLEAFNNCGVLKRIKRVGINFNGKYTSEFGSREYFIKKYGLDDDSIIKVIKEAVK